MSWQFQPYALLLLTATAVSLFFAYAGWRRRLVPGADFYAVSLMALAVWSLGYGLELLVTPEAAKLFWIRFSFTGIGVAVAAIAVFLGLYSSRNLRGHRGMIALLFLIPILTIIIIVIRPEWIWQSYAFLDYRGYTVYATTDFGWWFLFVHTPYAYLLYIIGLLLLVHTALRSPRLSRGQSIGLLLIGTLSLVANLIYFALSAFGQTIYDLTPLVVAATAWLTGWILLFFRPLDWSPLARDASLRAMPDGVLLLDSGHFVADLNPAAQAILEVEERADVLGLPAAACLSDDWWADIFAALENAPGELELRQEHNGETRDYSVQIEPVLDRSGRRIGTLFLMHDITVRRRAQAALFASRQQLQSAMTAAPMILLELDRRGVIELAAGSGLQELAVVPDELVGRALVTLVDDDIDLAADLDRVFAGEEIVARIELEDRLFEASFKPMGDRTDGITGAMIVALDVTDHVHMEQAAQELQRLESLGVLAGGIAHDFNNLLSAILSHASVAAARLNEPGIAATHLAEAIAVTERAAGLTRQLLAYAGKGQFQLETIDLNQLVTDNVELSRAVVDPSLSLDLVIAPQPTTMEGDWGQIQQVVANLVLNAIEAIQVKDHATGQIRVETGHGRLPDTVDPDVFWAGEMPAPGPSVFLCIADNGVGMDSETREHIFDPFYSTKQFSSGLGLSATLGIIRTHGGGLQIDSAPGKGTTFTLWFPAVDAVVEDAPAVPAATGDAGPTTILVVDDEETVRMGLCAMLEIYDYVPIEASDPMTALEIFRARGDEIDVVLTDMQMPGMTGLDLLREIRALSPTVRLMLSSGYSHVQISDAFSEEHISAFLQKPYRVETLVNSIEEALATG